MVAKAPALTGVRTGTVVNSAATVPGEPRYRSVRVSDTRDESVGLPQLSMGAVHVPKGTAKG
jgi:hypothetical protein